MESDENISIDRLEDQLIDNPDPSTTKQLSELSYDETFQKKLNERAEQLFTSFDGVSHEGEGNQLGSSFYLFLVKKPYLEYEYTDYDELDRELAEWFVSADYQLIELSSLPERAKSLSIEDLRFLDLLSASDLNSLLYYILGNYGPGVSKNDQLSQIEEHCKVFARTGGLDQVISLLLDDLENSIKNNGTFDGRLFKLLTVTYFVLNVELITGITDQVLQSLSDQDILPRLVKFIEVWRVNPAPPSRIRNVILLLWKLLLIELGDSEQLNKVNEYLNRKHGIMKKERDDTSNNRLTCSPLEYHTFREDLRDKYPVLAKYQHQDEKSHSKEDISESSHQAFMAANATSSLTNLLEMPRTNKAHSIYGQLPVNTLHIATPVPSPPRTPSDFMSGGEKIRKLYDVNQSMPFIYPTGAEELLPEAIKEADELFRNALYESYSIKRLWRERQRYMSQERGNQDHYDDSDTETYQSSDNDESDVDSSCKRSLKRVEEVYEETLPYLLSLAKVLIEITKSYKHELSLRDVEQEINPATALAHKFGYSNDGSYEAVRRYLFRQLESIHTKEICLKASSSIMILLLKWFKASHVVKSYYFNSILHDEQFFDVFTSFMANSLTNDDLHGTDEDNKNFVPDEVMMSQNKLMNPEIDIPQFNFFNVCSGEWDRSQIIELTNKTAISKFPSKVGEGNKHIVKVTKFNRNYCRILTNHLQLINKILIKGVSQRTFGFIETKPTDLLKFILLNYECHSFKIPILKIFKKIIPFQGRKWRAMNMDVISQVFLNLRLSIRDNWLSGRDLESDFNNSFDQEIALRSLIQFYNVRRYPKQMEKLGYTVSKENSATEYLEE